MNELIVKKLGILREYCRLNPDSITVVKLRAGAVAPQVPVAAGGYEEFLSYSDGARFGIIDFLGTEALLERQDAFRHLGMEMYCIGQVLYEPLFVDLSTSTLRLWSSDTEQLRGIGVTFVAFLEQYVLGADYARLCPHPEQDRWFQLLATLDFVEKSG